MLSAAVRHQLLLYAGWLCFLLGVIGMFLPLMPTTVFWIAAVWFWSKSNPALMQRIYAHPRFGRGVQDFLEHGCIARRGKLFALGGMLSGYVLFYWLVQPGRWLAVGVAVVLLLVASWLGSRPEVCADKQPR